MSWESRGIIPPGATNGTKGYPCLVGQPFACYGDLFCYQGACDCYTPNIYAVAGNDCKELTPESAWAITCTSWLLLCNICVSIFALPKAISLRPDRVADSPLWKRIRVDLPCSLTFLANICFVVQYILRLLQNFSAAFGLALAPFPLLVGIFVSSLFEAVALTASFLAIVSIFITWIDTASATSGGVSVHILAKRSRRLARRLMLIYFVLDVVIILGMILAPDWMGLFTDLIFGISFVVGIICFVLNVKGVSALLALHRGDSDAAAPKGMQMRRSISVFAATVIGTADSELFGVEQSQQTFVQQMILTIVRAARKAAFGMFFGCAFGIAWLILRSVNGPLALDWLFSTGIFVSIVFTLLVLTQFETSKMRIRTQRKRTEHNREMIARMSSNQALGSGRSPSSGSFGLDRASSMPKSPDATSSRPNLCEAASALTSVSSAEIAVTVEVA